MKPRVDANASDYFSRLVYLSIFTLYYRPQANFSSSVTPDVSSDIFTFGSLL